MAASSPVGSALRAEVDPTPSRPRGVVVRSGSRRSLQLDEQRVRIGGADVLAGMAWAGNQNACPVSRATSGVLPPAWSRRWKADSVHMTPPPGPAIDRRQAAATFLAPVSSETYQLLVGVLGWTVAAWQEWLIGILERELFGRPSR
jgi:hypothetical protein